MGTLLCITSVAIYLSLLVWITLRDLIPFDRLPEIKYRIILESLAFSIPAGIAGWLSALFSQVSLEAGGNALNIGWVIWLLISFLAGGLLGILSIAMGLKKQLEGMGDHDLIALGLGFLVGLLSGVYSILGLRWQPPRVLYSFWDEGPSYIALACLAIIALGMLLFVAWAIWVSPPVRRLRGAKEPKAPLTRKKKSSG